MKWYLFAIGMVIAVLIMMSPSAKTDASNCHIQQYHAPAVVAVVKHNYAQAVVQGTYYSNIVVGYTPEIPPAVQEKLLKQREEILNLRENQLQLRAELQAIRFGVAPAPKDDGTIPAPVITKDMPAGVVVLHNACFSCHNDKATKGDINLFPKGVYTTDPAIHGKVVNAIHERRMPPKEKRQLSGDDKYEVLSYHAIKPAPVVSKEPGTIPAP